MHWMHLEESHAGTVTAMVAGELARHSLELPATGAHHLLLLNKPVGLLVHPDDKEYTDTLLFRVQRKKPWRFSISSGKATSILSFGITEQRKQKH